MEGSGVLLFPILLKIEGHCHDIDGYNLSNTDDFKLDVASSPLSFSTSSTVMYYVSEFSLTLSKNFHRLGWYVAKANSWCCNLITLFLYHFLGVIKPIRFRFNDIP